MNLNIDNVSIYVSTGGKAFDPSLRSILFVHGAGLDHTTWVLYTRYFARRGCNALGIDLPGHGRSGGEPLTSIDSMAHWLIRLMDALEISKTAIVGHSMGSLVALELAAIAPDRVDAVVMLGTGIPMPVAEPLLNAAQANDHAAIDMITTWAHAYHSQLGGNPVAGISIMNNDMRVLEQSGDQVLFKDLSACNAYTQGLESAAKVRCPVSLLVGDRDQMTPPKAIAELADTLGKVSITMIPKCGHFLMAEQPEAVHEALAAALL